MAYGYNIVCFFSGDFGLSSYARQFVKAFDQNNVPFCIMNVSLPGRETDVKDFEKYLPKFSTTPKYDINVFIFGADFLNGVFQQIKDTTDFENKFNVFVPFWELTKFSSVFKKNINLFDMVLAPTEYIKYSLVDILDGVYLEQVPVCINLPNVQIKPSTKEFKFYYSFDLFSSLERKNPQPLIRAFTRTFNGLDTKLVLKFKGDVSGDFERSLRSIGSDNIEIVSKTLSYKDTIELMSRMDCYVSTHRSEGLGLGMMEAMSLGVPCIATGYGGNLEFMNNSNSMLIPYKLSTVECQQYSFICDEQNVWADIDEDLLCEAMLKMKTDIGLRKKIVSNAKDTINSTNKKFLKGQFIDGIKNVYQRTKK